MEEVASACPDRPGNEMGECLKDSEGHDSPTEISSGCTDFIALNKACGEDIENSCDGNYFHDDTILCLSKWVQKDNLTPKCQGVLSWAVPDAEEDGDKVVTDELGLSEEDHKEKQEWMAKRKAARGDAIERMKMKDVDRKNEEDRVALEEFKKNDPEGYENMMQQQEEEARQQAEFKKKERARAAAIERANRKASGADDEEDAKPSAGATKKASKKKGSWLYTLMSVGILAVVGVVGYTMVTQMSGAGKGSGGARKASGGKKKRG